MKPLVTAILLSHQRKANMPRIIDALRKQTVPVEIWVINNDGFEDFGADRLIAIPWNAGEWARYVFAGRVETKYAMFQDDDFMLGDDLFLHDAINIHRARCESPGNPGFILGVSGREFNHFAPHYGCDVHDGYASIIKGHFQLFWPSIVRKVQIPQHPSASDIYWSLDTGERGEWHWVSRELRQRLVELDRHGVGYEFRPGHYQEREQVCADWLEEMRSKEYA